MRGITDQTKVLFHSLRVFQRSEKMRCLLVQLSPGRTEQITP